MIGLAIKLAILGTAILSGSSSVPAQTRDNASPSAPALRSQAEVRLNTPPGFPPDYRKRLAALVIDLYFKEGKGKPEISEVRSASGILGGSSAFCIRFPADVKFTLWQLQGRHHLPRERDTRFISIVASRNIGTLGEVQYKAHFGPAITCEGAKGWKYFSELEQLASARRRRTR